MSAMSTIRAEYPYSLSYHTYIFKCVLSTTMVPVSYTHLTLPTIYSV